MIELSYQQQENIGFRYVLDSLSPNSPYGAEQIKALRPYLPEEREELLRQLHNLGRVLEKQSGCAIQIGKLQRILMCMKNVRRAAEKCREAALNEIELFELKRFLLDSAELLPLWREIQAVLHLDCIEMSDTSAALNILDPEHNRVASFYISESYSPRLRTLRKEKRELEERIRRASGEEKDALRQKRLLAAADEEHEERRVRGELSESLRPSLDHMLSNMDLLGELDLTLEKAAMAARWGGCMPELTDGGVEFKNMRNPQIADALEKRDKRFTPVSIALNRGATVLTGANMGGKSVAMKTVALNLLLAQCGFFPVAERARVPLFCGMFLISEDLESVDRGLSSFGGEIVRFNSVVERLKEGFSLVLLDEFARGTNPDEGAAIVQAVTEYLDRQNAVALLSTHYDNVAEHGSAHYQVIGLRDLDLEALRSELAIAGESERVGLIARHMDYGLYRVEGKQNCPRDALNICRLLGLKEEILSKIERSY
ncbi:MAG: DNA mismatch repair protein MutS [Clostridiaceae bacterium]|nr:DNA mismatch repair protein MutS [Clostridiaceae bacterium]